MHLFWFFVDGLAVAASAWLAGPGARRRCRGTLETLVAWGVLGVAVIAGAGVALGATGGFSAAGFLGVHLAMLGGLVAWRWRDLGEHGRRLNALARGVRQGVTADRATRWACGALAVFLVVTAILAATGGLGIYDALTYRLSRIGHWLQEGRIEFIATNDPRQNYMPVVPDVVMAWLLGGVAHGYGWVALAQWGGGVLMLTATVGMARQSGLGRAASVGAALVVAGFANVAPQFTTAHTDLFTAGLVAAAFFLWRAAAGRGEGSLTAGLTGGLALGAKGTVFYFLPTLALWALWCGWRHRLPVSAWFRTGLAGVAGALIFAAPGLWQNWRHYDGVFGPAEFVQMHHQGGGGSWVNKTALNLKSSAIQSLEPHSQMPGVDRLAAMAAGEWVASLPETDPFTFENANRREVLTSLLARRTPDADATAFGLLASVLVVLGWLTALGTGFRRAGAAEVRVLGAGVAGFLVFFHAMQQWHPYGFRYFILAAPWMGIVVAWWLAGLGTRLRAIGWGVALLSAACVGGHTLARTHNAGWPAAVRPEGSMYSYIFGAWRGWLDGLGGAGQSLQVALPFNRELAPFYRREGPRTAVKLVELKSLSGLSAEQAVAGLAGGWLITTPGQFADNEGKVVRIAWLFRGDAGSVYSLVAYRALHAGEEQ